MPKTASSKKNLKNPLVNWPVDPKDLGAKLLAWRAQFGRALPWSVLPPSLLSLEEKGYIVAVSELMMQQTTVAVGLMRFPRFIKRFPNWKALASASPDEVMKEWEGLPTVEKKC